MLYCFLLYVTWISHRCTQVSPLRTLLLAELTPLCHTAHPRLLSAFHMVLSMLPYYTLSSSLPPLSALCPRVCALRLHLHCACVPSHFSHVQLFVSLWPIVHQAPLFLGIPRQEHWSGLPCPPPGDLPNPGIEPRSLVSCSDRQVL